MTAPDAPRPAWVPRAGAPLRWDRSLEHEGCLFRWHSRLDGSALLQGPPGCLAPGVRVRMPVGHLHKPGVCVEGALYEIEACFEEHPGLTWARARRLEP